MKKLVVCFSIIILLVTGCTVKKEEEVTDAEKFAVEYSVSEENPFKYRKIDEVLETLKSGTGIIFFANSDCEFCVEAAKILVEALNYKNVDQVYYYNPQKIRDDDTEEYQELKEILDDFLETNKEEEKYLFLPDIYFVRDGKIIGHNNDLATMNGSVDEVLTTKRRKDIKDKYLELIGEYNVKECSGC